MAWLLAFALTLVIELPLAAALVPRAARRSALHGGFAINLCTHPLAWLALAHLDADWSFVEGAVLAAELVLYRTLTGLSWPRATLVSAVANGASAGAALLLYT